MIQPTQLELAKAKLHPESIASVSYGHIYDMDTAVIITVLIDDSFTLYYDLVGHYSYRHKSFDSADRTVSNTIIPSLLQLGFTRIYAQPFKIGKGVAFNLYGYTPPETAL